MRNLSIVCFTVMLLTVATKQEPTAVTPGQDGFLVDMDIILDLFAMAGLPANSITDWQTKMAVEIRGVIGAKLYAMARLDNIDPDKKPTEFAEWLQKGFVGKKILGLYAFGGNTLVDLCASIYLYEVLHVSVDIWITEPEYVASGKVYPAGDINYQIFNMLTLNTFEIDDGPIKKKIEILNKEVLSKYKTLEAPDPSSPFVAAKRNYLEAVKALKPLRDDPTPDDIKNYIALDTTNLGLETAIAKFFKDCQAEIQHAQAGENENKIIANISSYLLVTEAVVGASPSNGDFKLTFLPPMRIAFAAQKITRNDFNILATNDNPAMGLSVQGVGMSWIYRKLGLEPLQPSFNIHMGPVKKGVLYSDKYRKILHISIMPSVLEDAFKDHKIFKSLLLEGGVTWKYDSNGIVTPITHLKNGLQILDNLTYPVKVIKVSKSDATTKNITFQFTISQTYTNLLDRTKFVRELKKLFPDNFDCVNAITGGGSC